VTQLPKETEINIHHNAQVQQLTVTQEEAGQRLDNWLLRHLHGVPKTRVYKAIRKGEVRVNKGRAKAELRLEGGDVVRVPPLRQAASREPAIASSHWAERIRNAILFDDSRSHRYQQTYWPGGTRWFWC
jgi:Pseudouridylate synthases, 23S RNA-specific